MAGCIVMCCGMQRSGKTFFASLIAENFRREFGIPVYSNMRVPDWIHISELSELPFNFEPKIVLMDECYFYLDSRNWKDNTDSSIFFNTLGKQNCLLILTTITPDMVDMRLRSQVAYCVMAKGEQDRIYYKVIDTIRATSKVICIPNNPEVFAKVHYDTQQIPDTIKVDVKGFVARVKEFNKVYYASCPNVRTI